MERKIFLSLLSVGALSILLTMLAALTALISFADRQVYSELANEAALISAMIDDAGNSALTALVPEKIGGRVTLIATDGTVIYDTDADPASMESHADRPEFVDALKNGTANGKRSSGTFGETLFYYARRLDDGDVLRLSVPNNRMAPVLITSGVSALLLGGGLIIAAAILSGKLTTKITAPVRMLAADLADPDKPDITPGATVDDRIYPEFRPLVEKIRLQQKEIKRQLARVGKEKNRLATIINNMDEGLLILDNSLGVIMVNESACGLIGSPMSRSEAVGKPLREVCPSSEICECIERADSMNVSLDGRCLQLHVNHVVSNAEQVGRIALILDITERSEIERIKQEFTANVSHELKTPLTSISGYAELIETGMASGEDAKLFAGRIRRESARMLTLISDIIKLSQLDEETDGEGFEPVELYSVAEECMDVLEISAERHKVTLSLDGSHCELMGSASELSELVYNLIDNAIRYNRPGGSVRVKIDIDPAGCPSGAVAVLSVSDTGIGIAKEHIGRVFERFYRVDKSRSKETGGTGLGLAIVKHVAERHGAKLEVESVVGEGTTVRVIFFDTCSENL